MPELIKILVKGEILRNFMRTAVTAVKRSQAVSRGGSYQKRDLLLFLLSFLW